MGNLLGQYIFFFWKQMVDTKSQPYHESKPARIAFGIIEELLADQFCLCLFLIKCHCITIKKKIT